MVIEAILVASSKKNRKVKRSCPRMLCIQFELNRPRKHKEEFCLCVYVVKIEVIPGRLIAFY